MKHNKTYAKKPTKFWRIKRKTKIKAIWTMGIVLVLTGSFYLFIYSFEQTIKSTPAIASDVVEHQEELSIRDYVIEEAIKEGVDPFEVYMLVAGCENKTWNPEAFRVNNDKHHSIDRGIFQINSYWHPEVSPSCAFDYKCNTKEALRIYKERGWGEWTCGKLMGIN